MIALDLIKILAENPTMPVMIEAIVDGDVKLQDVNLAQVMDDEEDRQVYVVSFYGDIDEVPPVPEDDDTANYTKEYHGED